MKNFYFLLGGLILFIVLYRHGVSRKASLRVQHAMSTTIRYVILIGGGRVHGLSAAVDDQRHV